MVNEIYVNGVIVTNEWPKKQFKNGFKIRCTCCNLLIERKWFDNKVLNDVYVCKMCVMTTNNPMWEPKNFQKYLKAARDPERRKKHSERMAGSNNPFWNHTHSDESLELIRHANIQYNENITDEQKDERSRKASRRERNRRDNDPQEYSEQKRRAARASHKAQFRNYKPNKIEQVVQRWLVDNGISHSFSLILGFNQFDFGIKDQRVLIEVDGDYWHGNPNWYNEDGSNGKKKLNNIQRGKMEQDKAKNEWADERGFTMIRIWGSEVRDGSYVNKLECLL